MERSSKYRFHWLLYKGTFIFFITILFLGLLPNVYRGEIWWASANIILLFIYANKTIKELSSGRFEEMEQLQLRLDEYKRRDHG